MLPESNLHMSGADNKAKASIFFGVGFAVILLGILAAGLSPFRAPRNEVTWLRDVNGLRLGRYGTLWSLGSFEAVFPQHERACSLELWLAPSGGRYSGTILAFYEPGLPGGLVLRQWQTGLVLQKETWARPDRALDPASYVGGVFRPTQAVLIAITFDGRAARVYVNGAVAHGSRSFALTARDFRGQLVLGNSPVTDDNWSGELRGLALYTKELTADEIRQHYASWIGTGRPDPLGGQRIGALYLFREHSGRVVRNEIAPGDTLYIPTRYGEVHESFLAWPWNEYHPSLNYWKDLLINIAGFVPLGFICFAYLSLTRVGRRAALCTVLFGCLVSLMIEVLQAYLPTRNSGITDIITNTLGTAVGVGLYRCASLLSAGLARNRCSPVRSLAALLADTHDKLSARSR